MMTNLFSTFDPATSTMLSLNWISTFIVFMMIPAKYWILPNQYNMVTTILMEKLHNEFKMLMGTKSCGMTMMFMTLFMFILYNNVYGLLPYIFTSSSHLLFNLSLALPIWASLMLFGWINHTNHMFAHLIPSGTPFILMPFMVCIETISNLIRPGSLAVRLTANMIAGHLLMVLLGNNMITANGAAPLIMVVQMMLMLFETAVSLIQAYVFSVLSSLYSSEVI